MTLLSYSLNQVGQSNRRIDLSLFIKAVKMKSSYSYNKGKTISLWGEDEVSDNRLKDRFYSDSGEECYSSEFHNQRRGFN